MSKYYTIKYNMNEPTNAKIWTPQHSDYCIGVQVVRNDEPISLDSIKLFDGETEITTDKESKNGYKIWNRQSNEPTSKTLTIKVIENNKTIQKFNLQETSTDSTVWEIDEVGEEIVIPAPVAIYDNEDEEQATKKLDVDGKMYEKSSVKISDCMFKDETGFFANARIQTQTDDVITWNVAGIYFEYTKSTGKFHGWVARVSGTDFYVDVTPGLDVNDGGDYSNVLVVPSDA